MSRTHSLKLIVTVLMMVVASIAVSSAAEASHASPFSMARESHQVPVNNVASAVERDWLPYVVQSNESLVDIAERFNVPAPVLAATNGIADFDALAAGQVVWIPVLVVEEVAAAPAYVKAISSTVLYAGPAAKFGVAAKMRAGEAALVLGRSADGEWLRIASTSNASSRGWVKADSALFQMFALPVTPR